MRKNTWCDLAFFGGQAEFSEPLYVGRPNLGNREELFRRIEGVLSSKWLSNNGPLVQELEKRICDLLGVRHCVATCNGTVALEIGIRALGLNGEVIVPSFTFIATAHALQWQEITPVFCDVDRHTHNLDPRRVEELISPRTSGIMGVHLWGRPCAVEALSEIAHRRNLHLLFDAAHAFACSHHQRMIGNFGDLEVFSFHATKFFNTFEGGAIVTNDDALASRVRMMTNFGFAGPDRVVCLGTNGKMNEISAAMGLTGLESLDEFTTVNRRNYKQYQTELAGIPGVAVMPYDESEKSNYQYIVLEIADTVACITRDQLMEILRLENVHARRYFHPGCHQAEPYRSLFPGAGTRLPVTQILSSRLLTLPNSTCVSREQVHTICELIRLIVSHGDEIADRMLQLRRRESLAGALQNG